MRAVLYPPAGEAPFKRFTLATGHVFEPHFAKGGSVVVTDLADELELLGEGWTKTRSIAKTDLQNRAGRLDRRRQ